MAVAAPLCLAAVLLALSQEALTRAIPEEELPDTALASDDSPAEPRVPREFFDPSTQETDLIEDAFMPGAKRAEPKEIGEDQDYALKGPGGLGLGQKESKESRKLALTNDLSESEKSALNDEMEKEVSGELKKARALMKLGQNLGEPLDAEESLNDLPESGKEPLHDILKRAAEESMSDVEDSVNYIIDSLTSSTKKELEDKSAKSEVYESLEELLTKDKLNKINDLKKALDLLSKNTTAKKNDRDKALDELLAKDELAEISKRSGALEVLLPKDTIKEVRDVKRNPNELLAKHEINKISDVEGVLKELIPKDNIMKRSDVQVLGKLLAEDEIVKIKRADEPIETEGVLESLPKQISKRSEVKEVHQELLPGGKLTNVGETDEFLELIAEGKLIKDSLKLPKSMDSLPDEEEVVKELTELLQSSKDRHKKELLPDPELPELRRSRRNDKTSSEESIVKELIDDIQLQTKKVRKLPRIRARAITALPSRDLHALGEDASEPEGPGDHRQTRSNAGEHGLQELSPGALEDDSSLLEPLVQGSGEGTRRRRSVSETNDLELRHSADRFSRYERETANEQAGEGPKSLPAETYDPYPLDESLDLRQGRNVELVDREQSPDVDPQEQPETINTESLKSPKMLDDVNLQEGSLPAVESMAPQYVQDYNKAPELQPESGRAADLFWYRVSPDDELKAEEGANEGNKNATQAEGKGHERKGKTDSQKEAGTVRHEGDKRADDSSAAEDQKKTAASDTNRNDRSVEKENYSDNADNIDLTPEAQK